MLNEKERPVWDALFCVLRDGEYAIRWDIDC